MLKRIQEPEAWEPQINQAAFEALDMAIEALSQESSEDVISRQAAIDIVVFECGEWIGLAKEISKQLKQLPSTQSEIIRCRNCKYYYGRSCSAHDAPGDYLAPDDFCSWAQPKKVKKK